MYFAEICRLKVRYNNEVLYSRDPFSLGTFVYVWHIIHLHH